MAPHSSSSSSSSEDESKKEEHTRSSNPNPPPPQAQAQPPQHPPVVPTQQLGYPPAMGYPPPYQNYPPNYGHNPYNNPYMTPTPPPHYYATHRPYAQQATRPPGGSTFVRGFLYTLIIIIIFICVSSFVTWLILRPQVPVFHVDNLIVNNLNASRTDFAATWEANVTAENPNHKLKVYFDQIQSFAYYKENFLTSSGVDPLFLATGARDVMRVRLAANNTVDHVVGNWVVDEIAKERSGGVVNFNLRLIVLATFKSGAWWTRHASMKVFCDGFKVKFVGSESNGVMVGGNTEKCLVYYA